MPGRTRVCQSKCFPPALRGGFNFLSPPKQGEHREYSPLPAPHKGPKTNSAELGLKGGRFSNIDLFCWKRKRNPPIFLKFFVMSTYYVSYIMSTNAPAPTVAACRHRILYQKNPQPQNVETVGSFSFLLRFFKKEITFTPCPPGLPSWRLRIPTAYAASHSPSGSVFLCLR